MFSILRKINDGIGTALSFKILFTLFSSFQLCFASLGNNSCIRKEFLTLFHQINKCYNGYDKITLKETLLDWSFSPSLLLKIFSNAIDNKTDNYVRQVKNALFSIVKPIPFQTPVKLVAVSYDVLKNILDMDLKIVTSHDFLQLISGAKCYSKNCILLAHRYGGHQFGSWANQLGDGRAVLLGEYVNYKGERWELQLKGSGKTPYSRLGDGRAVIRSSVREFLCSEAMYYLGIPTSRALSLVISDDPVWRDQFYNGKPKKEKGAVVLRLARSWFRIGSLEILTTNKEIKLLRQLVDFIITEHFPNISLNNPDRYLQFYQSVVMDTAEMIAKWQSVAFTHGVCNTDNFSILSITIDYGPFGFMDAYNPDYVPNTSDDEGRYSYKNQPDVGIFNLNKLRIALLPLLTKHQIPQMETILEGYVDYYKRYFMKLFRAKIGIQGEDDVDETLVALLLKMMEDTKADFTMTFRHLGDWKLADINKKVVPESLWALQKIKTHSAFDTWLKMYLERLKGLNDDNRLQQMHSVNPRYILRNWIAQSIIESVEMGDFSEVQNILEILKKPFIENKKSGKIGLC